MSRIETNNYFAALSVYTASGQTEGAPICSPAPSKPVSTPGVAGTYPAFDRADRLPATDEPDAYHPQLPDPFSAGPVVQGVVHDRVAARANRAATEWGEVSTLLRAGQAELGAGQLETAILRREASALAAEGAELPHEVAAIQNAFRRLEQATVREAGLEQRVAGYVDAAQQAGRRLEEAVQTAGRAGRHGIGGRIARIVSGLSTVNELVEGDHRVQSLAARGERREAMRAMCQTVGATFGSFAGDLISFGGKLRPVKELVAGPILTEGGRLIGDHLGRGLNWVFGIQDAPARAAGR